MDAAAQALTAAIAALEEYIPVDTTALEAAIAKAKNLKAADYSEKTFTAMQKALTNAEAVLANAEATQEQVDAATKALTDAIDNLAPPTGTNPPTGDAFPMILWGSICMISLMMLTVAVIIRKRFQA